MLFNMPMSCTFTADFSPLLAKYEHMSVLPINALMYPCIGSR